MKSKRIEVTAESIGKAIKAGASSLTQVWRVLGGAGNVAGSTAARMRELVPGIDALTAANKDAKQGATGSGKHKDASKKLAESAPSGTEAPPRHPSNPYRLNSLYGTILDCMATPDALKTGTSRGKLTAMAAAILKRDPRLVAYGVTVVCSPKDTSPTCERHRSCREGYGIQKSDGGWVRLVLPQPKP